MVQAKVATMATCIPKPLSSGFEKDQAKEITGRDENGMLSFFK